MKRDFAHKSWLRTIKLIFLLLSIAIFIHYWEQFKPAFSAFTQLGAVQIVLMLALSALNWLLEIFKWHYSLVYFGIRKRVIQSGKQVAYGLLASLALPKALGHAAGRLALFNQSEISRAAQAQIVSGVLQSLCLCFGFIASFVFGMRAYAVLCGLILILMVLVNKNEIKLLALAWLRMACILSSYAVVSWPNAEIENWLLAVQKTFIAIAVLPLTPLSSLGIKEWLMTYFSFYFEINQVAKMSFTVFAFNLVLPTVIALLFLAANYFRHIRLRACTSSLSR